LKQLSKHLNFANVISCIALFVALSGAAYAAKATLGNKAVKTRNLANGSVNTLKLRSGAVTTLKLRNGAVTGAKIAAGAVGSTQLVDGGVRSVDLGGGVVTESKLKNGAVTDSKLAANSVTAGKLQNGAVTEAKLGTNSVATGKLQNGAVTSGKLASSFLGQLVKNVSYATKQSESNTDELKTIVVECPSGKQAISGGGVIHGFISPNVAVTESAPAPVNAENKRTGWTLTARAFKVEPEEWSVEGFAVCAEF
jgi:hypothetical protein